MFKILSDTHGKQDKKYQKTLGGGCYDWLKMYCAPKFSNLYVVKRPISKFLEGLFSEKLWVFSKKYELFKILSVTYGKFKLIYQKSRTWLYINLEQNFRPTSISMWIVSIILRKLSIDKPFTELVVTKILTWKAKINIMKVR